jgi:hypothetical protein
VSNQQPSQRHLPSSARDQQPSSILQKSWLLSLCLQ